MPLAKPPLVEVGVEFQFDPRPDKRPWSLATVVPFFDQFLDAFPHVETVEAEEIKIEKRSRRGVPVELSGKVSLDKVRAHDDEGARWIQVGDDLLAYNLVRRGGHDPGFKQLRDEAFEKLERYIDHFKPVSVRRAAVTYVDLIEIPVAEGTIFRLEDYFRLRVEVPDEVFGPVGSVSLQLHFPPAPGLDGLGLWFRTVPVAPGQMVYRFQMLWHCQCDDVRTLDKEELARRLDAARQRVYDCFRASFTDRGWDSFQPTEGS